MQSHRISGDLVEECRGVAGRSSMRAAPMAFELLADARAVDGEADVDQPSFLVEQVYAGCGRTDIDRGVREGPRHRRLVDHRAQLGMHGTTVTQAEQGTQFLDDQGAGHWRGLMPFSFAYCIAESTYFFCTSLRSSGIGAIQSVTMFHFAPSQRMKRTRPEPS